MIPSEKPLTGLRILITRSEAQAIPFIKKIERLGGTAISAPLITFRLPADLSSIEHLMKQLDQYKWIVFTSQNAVRFFLKMAERLQLNEKDLKNHKLAAIGEKTESLLNEHGLDVHFSPTEYVAEQFVEEFGCVLQDDERVLFPHGSLARDTIASGMEGRNKQIDSFVAYETVPDTTRKQKLIKLVKQGEVDIVTFTSSSTVHLFFEHIRDELSVPTRLQFACIGPITAGTLESYGFKANIIASVYTIDGLLDSIVKKVREEKE
ncbi:uroporphyrinogen-III synthase [Alkalihalobacillus sp. AL-G]|uniref:uroporphyrinogen-III synthase n=1 Tax=Alkalihalobacillus sp. AL-G TaxID=2926399 RepID=UPI002729F862|nr:uroporphyrinogen-III synthase [Alkalihalobacillus sp. AL-G]WLD92264.1 uroporphyrinogen-III synthase [Alkalihalobacillus sp. AL-G]